MYTPRIHPTLGTPGRRLHPRGVALQDREEIFDLMTADPRVRWASHITSAAEIDRINILQVGTLQIS